MFSIGIIGTQSQITGVNLRDFEIKDVSSFVSFVLLPDGKAHTYDGTSNVAVPDMWWIGSAPANIGNSYDLIVTIQAGSGQRVRGAFGSSLQITEADGIYFSAGVNGRSLLQLYERSSGLMVASCRVWRGSSFAP